MRVCFFFVVVVLLLLLGGLRGTTAADGEMTGDYSKLSGIIIPGFASTQLRAWSFLDCPYSPLDFNPLDLVWLDTTKLLSAVNCWLKCMLLEPYNQTDHPECKSRPDSGLSAITELDPGYITGPLSSVWKEWIKWCIEFGIEANAIIAVPYDWRLAPSKLEERDLYFHKLKLTFETALKLRGGPSLVFAHSLGNNVFRYFLEWLKLEIAPKHYTQWLDEHIHAYFAVGAPFLGATETVKAALSGVTFGLPVSEGTARLMSNSFGSSLWMMPFSKYCRADNIYWKHFSGGIKKDRPTYHCDEREFQSNYSGWPTNIVNIEIPSVHGYDAYPSVTDITQTNLSSMECGFPTQLSFSAREVSDGTFFKSIEDYDPESKKLLHQLQKSYHNDPVLNPLTPWDRPPIKNVFCIYGIDMKTEVGHYFAPSGKPYPDNWIITDIVYELEGTLISRSGNLVEGNPGTSSGDETVPYHSLSWCKNWLGPRVNVTRAPQSEHDGSNVQVELNVEHLHGADIIPNMTKSPRAKYITYYEDSESIPEKGCLLIKKSVMATLQNQSGRTGSGMVKILPVYPQYLSDSVDGLDDFAGVQDNVTNGNEESMPETHGGSQMPAFSGVFTSNQVRDVFELEMDQDNSSDRDGASTIFEEAESISVGEVMKSPIFSEDESSDNSYWIDLGQSPFGSDNSGQLTKQKTGSPLLPSWFSGKRNNKTLSPKASSNLSKSPIYDDRRVNVKLHDDPVLSFDAAVLSVSQELDHVREIPEEEQLAEAEHPSGNGEKHAHFQHVVEIEEESEIRDGSGLPDSKLNPMINGFRSNNQTSGLHHGNLQKASTSEICQEKESAIRRETEGDFRLLGRRDGNRFGGGRFFVLEENDRVASMGRRVSFSMEDNRRENVSHLEQGDISLTPLGDDESISDVDYGDEQEWESRDPDIICRHLDHINMLGLNKTTLRLRYLINWLVTSLLQLRLPGSGEDTGAPLVQIYGPKIKYERGASVAFNVKESCGKRLIHPEVVQKLAEKNGISLGIGILSHIRIVDSPKQNSSTFELEDTALCKPMANGRQDGKNVFYRIEVVTASLGFLTNFEDVYKMWAFVAKFLNPSFAEEDLSTVPEDSEM